MARVSPLPAAVCAAAFRDSPRRGAYWLGDRWGYRRPIVAALHSLDRDEPLVVYRALKARIQAIAQEKYRKRLKDEDGAVVVRRRDLEAV